MEKTMSLTAKEHTINDFFGMHRVRMPDYQRPYSWDEDQAGSLLSDLEDFYLANSASGSSGMYFLGSIVLVGKNRRQTCWDVLDGQQRLITVTMVFSAYRELSASQEAKNEIDKLVVERT